MGAIKPIDPAAPYARLVDDYFTAEKKKKTVLVISPTHQQGEAVTDTIRQRLKQEGRIGRRDKTIPRLVNCQLTEADKRDGRNYHEGQAILFNRKLAGFRRGSIWSVSSTNGNGLIVQDKDGNTASLPLKQVDSFEVYNRAEIPLAVGDSIRITRNGKDAGEKRLNNGQTMEVTGFDRKGNIRTRNPVSKAEYTLPAGYGHIIHAYCVTSHGSQGKTVDEIFIAQPAATFPATNLKQFYVSVSRARDAVHIYTDDVEGLLDYASSAGDRISAMELLNGKQATQEAAEKFVRDQVEELRPEIKITKPSQQIQAIKRVHVRPYI
jgi:ATP-dependent exoDNAse (exonuclease V) alpha subunit